MFDDLLESLNEISVYTDEVEDFIDRDLPEIYRRAEELISDALVRKALEAFDLNPEYSNGTTGSDLLRTHLIENLSNPNHVLIDESTGSIAILFDEELAGTYNDLISGMRAAYSSPRSLKQRAIFWKYGIYLPSVGEDTKVDSSVDYTDVVIERLREWGDKAPYWYLLEYGNTGGGYSYPSFSGRRFLYDWKTESKQGVDRLNEEIAYILDNTKERNFFQKATRRLKSLFSLGGR